jgi:hypothetical protein
MTDEEIYEECKKRVDYYIDLLYSEIQVNAKRKTHLDNILDGEKVIDYEKQWKEARNDSISYSMLESIRFLKEHPNLNPHQVINHFVKQMVFPWKPPAPINLDDENLISI